MGPVEFVITVIAVSLCTAVIAALIFIALSPMPPGFMPPEDSQSDSDDVVTDESID